MEHWFADLCVAVAAEDPERFEAILLRPEVDVNESVEWWSGDLLNCGTALRYCAGHGTAWMVGAKA